VTVLGTGEAIVRRECPISTPKASIQCRIYYLIYATSPVIAILYFLWLQALVLLLHIWVALTSSTQLVGTMWPLEEHYFFFWLLFSVGSANGRNQRWTAQQPIAVA